MSEIMRSGEIGVETDQCLEHTADCVLWEVGTPTENFPQKFAEKFEVSLKQRKNNGHFSQTSTYVYILHE
jgi:hypothetical protein